MPDMKTIMKRILLPLFLATEIINAQQDPQFTQFMHSKLIYNPGYAGNSGAICTNVMYRKQWVSFPGAPTSALLSFDMPLLEKLGLGVNVMSDEIGALKSTYARVGLSFIQKTSGQGKFGIGLDGGLLQVSTSNTWIVPEPGKPDNFIPGSYQTGNLSVDNPNLNKASYDLNLGAYYTYSDRIYAGLSTSHLTSQSIKASANIYMAMARHYYLMAGYKQPLNPRDAISGNIKVRSDASTTQIDINATYSRNGNIWTGISYRPQDAVALLIGGRPGPNLKMGYSYDITTSKMRGYSSGTHEIFLSYCFILKKVISAHDGPRFLNGVFKIPGEN